MGSDDLGYFMLGFILYYVSRILIFILLDTFLDKTRSIKDYLRDNDIKYRFLLLVDKIRVWCNRK